MGLAIFKVRLRDFKEPLILWCLLLLLTWGSFYSFVSTLNFGSAMRFKLQVLPILLGFIFYFLQKKEDGPHGDNINSNQNSNILN